MNLIQLAISDVLLIEPCVICDARGFFVESWNRRTLCGAGINTDFVQDNHSLSHEKYTLRGLHFQSPPHAQDKLVRVVRGAVLDVIVDIRCYSPDFGRHVTALISAENKRQIFIPKGFAHGFLTLKPDTEVLYKTSDYYEPSCDKGLAWNDPALAIEWGLPDGLEPLLSDKDKNQPKLAELGEYFNGTIE